MEGGPHDEGRRRIVGRIVQKKKRSRWYVLTLEVIEEGRWDSEEEDDLSKDEETDAVVVPSTQVIYISKSTASSSSYQEFALYIHSIIAVTGYSVDRLPSEGDDDNNTPAMSPPLHRPNEFFLVEQWQWIQCPPHLRVIADIVKILRRRTDADPSFDLISVLVPFHASPEYRRKELEPRLEAALPSNNERIFSQLQHWILRGLQGGGDPAHSVSRQRKPRVARADRELLQRLSDVMEPHFVPLVVPTTESIDFPPRPFAQSQSARGPWTRQQYMQYKKEPQVQWLLQRIEALLPAPASACVRILDIGGGRGDLAVSLARRWPQAHITVVDRHPLTACREWAAQQGVPLMLRQVDFFAFLKESAEQKEEKKEHWDCVVAWHACGDLTDAALLYAQHHASAWIICPCCYNKTSRPEDSFTPPFYRTLENDAELRQALPRIQRLAETSQDAATSRQAALWINGRRLAALAPDWQVRLEAFCPEYSARNLVLVGTKASSGVDALEL